MTREEARKNIIAFTIAYAEEDWPLEIGESLGMAISALSENKELRENIEKVKAEICDEYASTHSMYPDYAGGLSRAYLMIDKCIGKADMRGE